MISEFLQYLRTVGRKEMAAATLCGLVPVVVFLWKAQVRGRKSRNGEYIKGVDGEVLVDDNASVATNARSLTDNSAADSSLLKKHSRVISVTTSKFTYPKIRIFHRTHPKEAVLPPKLPLLVFVHGLGGQVAQFQFLIDFFVHISHVLGIDLPGCGGSEFSPKDFEAYTPEALVEILSTTISQFLEEGQKFVLVSHSMGCSLSAKLISTGPLTERCAGFVAICPKAELTAQEAKQLRSAVKLPEFVFDLWRRYDRRGGLQSPSVARFVGPNPSKKVKALQHRFNEQSRTPVWRRMVSNLVFATPAEWQKIKCPIYLMGASEDKVCKVEDLEKIASWLDRGGEGDNASNLVAKTIIPNSGHAVIYSMPQILSKFIGEFLSTHVSEALDLGWQLSYLKEDKWLLKNLNKWMKIEPVSNKIEGSRFRAMKTLRQNDEFHNPMDFAAKYPDIRHIIDISHEQPPYDPETLGERIKYHKFPTVSKIPPTISEVQSFIELVDGIISEMGEHTERSCIAVHCHYGFNRTGFFLVSYLIERLNFTVPEALAAFKKVRNPGIRHPHFINELFERYTLGGTA